MKQACVFAIDENYVTPFQVFFHSLEVTESIPATTSIFVLHAGSLRRESVEKLRAFVAAYGRRVTILDASGLIPKVLPIRDGDHVSPTAFCRLFAAELIPADIDQAVYLDADMLALRSAADLFAYPVEELVAAADGCSPDNGFRLWGAEGGSYFQSGVLVIPLRKWRQMGMAEYFDKVMKQNSEKITLWDQDILNLAIRERWERLPIWFNITRTALRLMSFDQVEQNAVLIHFTGRNKPWNSFNPSPFTKHWDQAYETLFGQPFNRRAFRPSRIDLINNSLRSRISRILQRPARPLDGARTGALTLCFALNDTRTPRLVRILCMVVLAYALSPIDLIPDFIPVVGLLDDALLIPLGVVFVLKLIPVEVRRDAADRANADNVRLPKWRAGAVVVVFTWVAFAAAAACNGWLWFHSSHH